VLGLIDLIGADRVCFGSDFPHPEGLDDPLAWHDEIAELPPSTSRRSCPPTCSTSCAW
jgi:predicted TIM-barrel fold metal-dependent hydrolase